MLASRFFLEKGQPRQARLKFGTRINSTSPYDGPMSGWLGPFDFLRPGEGQKTSSGRAWGPKAFHQLPEEFYSFRRCTVFP